MSRWFRFYDEALGDPKVQKLPPHLFKAWVNLLCLASKAAGVLPSVDDISFHLRMSEHDTKSVVDELILAGLIDIEPTGCLRPHNWNGRQFTSDTSKERTRKYRENKKKAHEEKACDVTSSVTVTECDEKRDDLDTESESETEQKRIPLTPRGGPTPMDAMKAFESYNAVALRCGLQQAAKLTPDRQRKLIARLRDYGGDGWIAALEQLERSAFLKGKNDKDWRANLDFLLQPSSFSKVYDGAFGNGRIALQSTTVRRSAKSDDELLAAAVEQLREDGISI